ncbi:MAG TPA: tripartite tricarboxylate transporter substrate binding protein [Xanthobacteraceae bacterium]|nr:tripartite tricarboxylate transporter substrate binding protein [Xanthobacteraceae bacterium]
MKTDRRRCLQLAAGAAALAALPGRARALDYPTRPVRIIVGLPPGSGPDIDGRLIAQWLGEKLGQPFVVENHPGAATNIATAEVIKAPADGYTLLACALPNAINATLYDKLSFDFLRDTAPVARIGSDAFVMVVTPSLPATTVPEFIAYAKANPGKVNMASAGSGSALHIFGAQFEAMAGVDLVHVPYRGSYIPDLLAGQVQVAFAPLSSMGEQIRAGKLRMLAVTTATRLDPLPDVPTLGEFLPGYEADAWLGFVAPRDTPPEAIATLNRAINAALADPEVAARMAELGTQPVPMTPAAFGAFMAAETEKWAKVIRAANIKPE